MTPELFSDAMNEIGAKYVEEALTYKQAKPRALRRVLRTLLAAALISVLLFTSAFALSPSLREKAMTAFVHIFNDHTEVRFDGSEEFEPHGTGAIDCSALDGDYTVIDTIQGGWRNTVQLERADGAELRVTTTEISDSLSYNFDSEDCSETPITLYGKDATLYIKQDGSGRVSIVQIDTERGWIIRFSAGGLTADELLDAAASIAIL